MDNTCYLILMPRPRGPATEMLRLPADVAQALRRRAVTADVTIAEAARHLMLPPQVSRGLSLLDHAAWLHGRLQRQRDNLVEVFRLDRSDPKAVDRAMKIEGVRLVKKTGGKSGDVVLE